MSRVCNPPHPGGRGVGGVGRRPVSRRPRRHGDAQPRHEPRTACACGITLLSMYPLASSSACTTLLARHALSTLWLYLHCHTRLYARVHGPKASVSQHAHGRMSLFESAKVSACKGSASPSAGGVSVVIVERMAYSGKYTNIRAGMRPRAVHSEHRVNTRGTSTVNTAEGGRVRRSTCPLER